MAGGASPVRGSRTLDRPSAPHPSLSPPGRGSAGAVPASRDSMRICLAAIALAISLSPAAAQDAATFPSRPIRIIVPFPAGGPTDINARIIAQRMSEDFKQPVVVENRPGGNTAIAAQAVAKAEPDGYTLLAAMDTTLVMNPATATAPLTYDPFHDFATITLTAKNTSLLTVRAADGPKSVH